MYSIYLLLLLAMRMALVQCEIGNGLAMDGSSGSSNVATNALHNPYDTNAMSYVLNGIGGGSGGSSATIQSFTADDRRPLLYTPYGFYGGAVNQYLASNGNDVLYHQQQHQQQQQQSSQQQQQSVQEKEQQQQAKVKKDIKEVDSGNTLILDDIR